ncbi:hypothetical protein BDR04DRAFT_1118875 [Suillus decipiens]|nr:hypothetical protein BDR04DRAFT_1118875 [Suillus decipiens]
MDVFGKGTGKETALDDADHEDDKGGDTGPLNEDLEPGKIMDDTAYKDDDPPVQADDSGLYMFCDDEDLGWYSPSDTSGSLSSCPPCPQLPQVPSFASSTHFQPSDLAVLHHYQCPFITHLNTTQQSIPPLEPNDISLNLPEPEDRPKYPLLSANTTNGKARAASVQMDTSEDSDMAASHMMKLLTMHSRKASLGVHTSSGHISSDQDSDQSPTTSHNRSASHKWLQDPAAELTMKLNEVSDTLIQHIQEASTVKANHKHLKLETQLASRELKMRESHAEREHGLWTTITIQNHERAMADE